MTGVPTFVETSRALPFVSVVISFRSGSVHDPAGREGLSRVTARMLRRGCEGYTKEKIEETIDYLLLEKGELVAMSSAFAHPSLEFEEIGLGELVAVTPADHPLAARSRVSVRELVREPLIGVSPDDPYGAIIAGAFRAARLDYRLSIRARFAQTVVSLVREGLGVAVIDEFSVAGRDMPGIARIPLEDPPEIRIFAMAKRGRDLSAYAAFAKTRFREELRAAVRNRPWLARPR